MIDNTIIEEIMEVAQCYEVIKDFITLKKSGTNWEGLSPFTDEKTPSFTVSPAKNIWKDFSSGNGGHAITFLMKARGMSFPEAIKYLGKKYNIEIKENKKSNPFALKKQKEKKAHLAALDFSKNHFYNNLKSSQLAKDYVIGRGFSPKIVKKFQLGYSLDSWDDLKNSAAKDNHSLVDLEDVDLIVKKGRSQNFDKFRNRMMFPISNVQGNVIGYGARVLDDSKPKYLNSKESNIYKKSHVLYAMDLAIQDIMKHDICYVVEGYTDVISFHQEDVCNTVASCGTALTVEQLKLIKRYTMNLGFILDGDKAGIKATFRSIDLALHEGFNVSVLKLKDVDPDELAKSCDNLKEHIDKNMLDFVEYKVSFITNKNIDNKAKQINNIIQSITLIDDDVKRRLYSEKVTKIFDLNKSDFTKAKKEVNNKAFKQSLTKKHVFYHGYLNDLTEMCEINPHVSIKGISLLNHVILKIQELEEPIIYDFQIEYSSEDLVIKESKALALEDEIDDIFKSIKLERINSKLSNIDNEDLNFIQDLISVKQNL